MIDPLMPEAADAWISVPGSCNTAPVAVIEIFPPAPRFAFA